MKWLRRLLSKPSIAIGPATQLPSWKWIGEDTARGLSASFRVKIYEKDTPPKCDAALIVKHPPHREALERLKQRGTKIVYMPVDFFQSVDHIAEHGDFLRSCSSVLLHSERLRNFVSAHAREIVLVDHHNKYGIEPVGSFRETGPVLWIGGYQYLPYLLHWRERSSFDGEILVLSDFDLISSEGRRRTEDLASSLGVKLEHAQGRGNGIKMRAWSTQAQAECLRAAKAAVDIKGGRENFNQFTKPPTKAQKYVVSGIPFAANEGHPAIDAFRRIGFEVATTDDTRRWFSREYWQETQDVARRLRESLELSTVCRPIESALRGALGAR